MSGYTFRAIREALGLSTTDIADMWDIARRTPERWEAGRVPVPLWAAESIAGLEERAAADTARLVAELHDTHVTTLTIPDDELPERWHRAIAARVRREIPGLGIARGPAQ